MNEPIRSSNTFDLPFPVDAVWPILSRTDWLNRSLGLPPIQYEMTPLSTGGARVEATARFFGLRLRWEEHPFEWIEGKYYRVRRVFESGPLAEAVMGMSFAAAGEGASRVNVFTEMTPRNLVGSALVRFVLIPNSTRDMAAVFDHISRFLAGQRPAVLPKLPVTPSDERALSAAWARLRETHHPPRLLDHLERWLREAPDVELTHVRPFAVARRWEEDRWDVLRLFLQATRCGLFELSWEILCPNCRSSRAPAASSLNAVKQRVHCDVCQINYDGEFDRSVELKFRVCRSIRPVEAQTFCLVGPGGRPHVVSQLLLEPGQRRSWQIGALEQPYRLRSPQVKESVILTPEETELMITVPLVVCEPDAFRVVQELGGSREAAIQVMNPNPFPLQLILERVAWDEDILTAARVTNWQDFRDLFVAEVISPHEQITVGAQIILFTDLRGSTAMYQGLGDAPAYALVRNHFLVLIEAVREHHGAVVKTIGDAVMASFSRVDEALRAVKQMHDRLPASNSNPNLSTRLFLKSSLHLGPCLAVNANDKLDFFGTTVNLAARMVDCCRGGDVVLSDDLYQRPETKAFLKQEGRTGEPSEVRFRGFASPHRVWRVLMTTEGRLRETVERLVGAENR